MVTWDLLQQEWDSLTGWSGGTVVEISPAGQLHCLPATGSYCYAGKDTGTFPDDYTVEFLMKIDSFGTGAGLSFNDFYDGIHHIGFSIYSDHISMANSTGGETNFAFDTNNDWHTWRLLVDSDGHNVKVYRDGVYVTEFTDLSNYTLADGTVQANGTQNPTGKSNCECHMDYLYIATGLYPPLTTYTKTYSIDILLQKLGIPKTYSMDALFKKLGVTIDYSVDVVLERGTIPYHLDVLFQKFDAMKSYIIDNVFTMPTELGYDIDVIFIKLALYNIDVLFAKLDTTEGYDIDVLLKKLNILITYNIDVLFKRYDITSTYSIDVKISEIPSTTTIVSDGGTLAFTPLEWNEGQKCDVAIRPVPLATSAFIDAGTYVLKTKEIFCRFRASDSEKNTLKNIFSNTALATLYLRASGSNNYWQYTVWLRDKDIKYEYRKESDADRPWFVTLIFDVESYVYGTV